MSTSQTELSYGGLSFSLPATVVSIAMDEDGDAFAFFDVPVMVESENRFDMLGNRQYGYWSTTLAEPDFAPIFIGHFGAQGDEWKKSLLIVDAEAAQNAEDEVFDNAKWVL